MSKPVLTAERVREVLCYDPETGVFTWRVNMGNVKAGAPAGWLNQGYLTIAVDGKEYRAHRLAWLYMTGEFPKEMIDHRNNVRADNRFANLREADRALNNQNLKGAKRSNKSTGLLGAYAHRDRFTSYITVEGKSRYLGIFDTAEMAHTAYLHAKRQVHPGCTI